MKYIFYKCSDKLHTSKLISVTGENRLNFLLGITGKGFTQGLKTSTEFGEADKMKVWEMWIKKALGRSNTICKGLEQ